MATKSNSSGGIGFFGLLTILFVGLKLANVIDWSWRLVLLPLYGPVSLLLCIALFAMCMALRSRK